MTTDELIEAGICEDLEEALRMFPIDVLEDFTPSNGEHVEAPVLAKSGAFATVES